MLAILPTAMGLKLSACWCPVSALRIVFTAQSLAGLVDSIESTGARAILLEASSNPQVAEQIANETDAKVVTDLYTHSLSGPNGHCATYLQMLEYDTQKIVDALK